MFRERFFPVWSHNVLPTGEVDGVVCKSHYSGCLMYGPVFQTYWPAKPTLFSA